MIVSLYSATVLVIGSYAVCLLTVFSVRNLSPTYKSVINKESLTFLEFHGARRVPSSWYNYFLFCLALSRKYQNHHNSFLSMMSFRGFTLLIKHFYQFSQCFRHKSILLTSLPSFPKRIVKKTLYCHFLIFIPLCIHTITFLTTCFFCVGYFVWKSTITFLKVPPGHLFTLLLALFSS